MSKTSLNYSPPRLLQPFSSFIISAINIQIDIKFCRQSDPYTMLPVDHVNKRKLTQIMFLFFFRQSAFSLKKYCREKKYIPSDVVLIHLTFMLLS